MNDPTMIPVWEEATRLPPQALEAEQGILGGLMLDNTAWDRVADVVAEKDFYRSDHRVIWHAIAELISLEMPADHLTVADALGEDLARAGGTAYLASLVSNTPGTGSIRRYAELVRERAVRRSLIALCNETSASLYDRGETGEVLAKLEDGIFRLATRSAKGAVPFPELVSRVMTSIDARFHEGGKITGLATGFTDLDEKTAGFQPGDLIVIAGRPSMGKTALAMNIVEHATLVLNKSAAVFSLEMSDEQIAQRMIGSVGSVNQHQLRTGRLENDDWERISKTAGDLSGARVVIEETYDLDPTGLRAKARRIKRQNPDLALMVVDYLQLMEGQAEKRVDQVAEITRGLKRIAKELQIPVVALSQLNRAVEARTNKRPMMADLRESGAIEQDADLILFMYRDEVYHEDTLNPGVCEVIIGKQRNGPLGYVNLTFLAQYARFENFAGTINYPKPRARSRAFDPAEQRQRKDWE